MNERDILGGQPQQQLTIEDVINMLRQGATPEQLVQQGIPVEMIQEAIAMLQQPSAPTGGGRGLSDMMGR